MAITGTRRTVDPGFRLTRGQWLICRLIPRGFRRERLETTFSLRSSRNTLSWNAGKSRGGESRIMRQLSADDPHGVDKR